MFKRVKKIIKINAQRAVLCVIHRRLPFRSFFGVGLVNKKWARELNQRLLDSNKVKVGFGPVISGEDDLGVRKWRIDPIVNYINQSSKKYCAGIFLNVQQAEKFDILVIVKDLSVLSFTDITQLKKNNKKIIYDVIDQPYGENAAHYPQIKEIFKVVDAIIVSSPLQEQDLLGLNKIVTLIEHPVINTLAKDYSRGGNGPIKIIWQGYSEHHKRMEFLHPMIERIAKELGKKITLTYHTNLLPKRNGFVNFKTWTVNNWEKALVKADIAVEVKTLDDPLLQRKPSTKAVLYGAVALPVVLTPSAADKLVVTHGQTGYFAYSREDWYIYLKKLAENVSLRQSMGLLAKQRALENFNIAKIGEKYISLLDKMV